MFSVDVFEQMQHRWESIFPAFLLFYPEVFSYVRPDI